MPIWYDVGDSSCWIKTQQQDGFAFCGGGNGGGGKRGKRTKHGNATNL